MDNTVEYRCMCCGRMLVHDEIALYKRLFNRSAESFMCIDCCSSYLGVPVSLLEKKTQEFKAMGCTLFLPEESYR